MITGAQVNQADLRETFRRNYVHIHARPPSVEELANLIAAEQAAADYDGKSRARTRHGDRAAPARLDLPARPAAAPELETSVTFTPPSGRMPHAPAAKRKCTVFPRWPRPFRG